MEFLKKNIRTIIGFLVGVILASSITVYAYNYLASDISYTKDGTEMNVEDALNDLYNNCFRLNSDNLKLIKGTNKISTTIGKKYLIVFNITSLTSQAYTPSLASGYKLIKETDLISASFNDYIYKTKSFIVEATAEEIIVNGSGDVNWNSISYYEF